jgi:flagellar basal-body rod protein FlgB
MGVVHLFDLASQQARWLSARHIAVASNIANANTPGYKAADVAPFETVFNDSNVTLTTTNPLHIGIDPLSAEALPVKGEGRPSEVSHSGNSVSIEQEMLKSGEVMSAFTLNRAVTKAFNQMLMTSLRG